MNLLFNPEKTELNIFLEGMVPVKIVDDGSAESIEYHLLDNLGSRRVTTNSAGNVIDTIRYAAFGDPNPNNSINYSF